MVTATDTNVAVHVADFTTVYRAEGAALLERMLKSSGLESTAVPNTVASTAGQLTLAA